MIQPTCIEKENRKALASQCHPRPITVQPHAARLGAEYLASLITADTPEHGGRSILRMVFEIGKWQSLPVLVRAAAMNVHAEIAFYAERLIELWFTPPRSVRVFTRPTESQRKQLVDSLAAARQEMRPEFLADISKWLKTYHLNP
ncbi:MAG TPA: hypothetical protein DCY79_16900 [Planctomycetaceae bacterium]|nr:hypothetical protein [Planctomycetaceae bacterium]